MLKRKITLCKVVCLCKMNHAMYDECVCFLKYIKQCSRLFSEMARYEGRVKQIFLTSVQASTLEDDHHDRAGIEFVGDMDGVRGLVSKEKAHDTFAKMISHHRGVLEGGSLSRLNTLTVK